MCISSVHNIIKTYLTTLEKFSVRQTRHILILLQGDTRIECKQNIPDTIEVIDERGLTIQMYTKGSRLLNPVNKSVLGLFVDNFNYQKDGTYDS